jgi:hypothetical protein
LPLPEARTGVADYTNELDPEDEVEEYGLLHVHGQHLEER